MRCSVCDYAMKEIGGKERISWCPSCGTVNTEMYKWIPEIVQEARKVVEADSSRDALRKINGLIEYCYPPNER